MSDDKTKCPACGSANVASILHGYPALTDELKRQIDAGEVILGGCCITPGKKMLDFECRDCGARFTRAEARKPSPRAYFAEGDLAWLQRLAEYGAPGYEPLADDEGEAEACADVARAVLDRRFGALVACVQEYGRVLGRSRALAKALTMGLEYGAVYGNGPCATELGALYYNGEAVGQDYAAAQKWYERGEELGETQSIINLGYIYEYGRNGERDQRKAYMQYAKAAALDNAPEAIYKMGDIHSRGRLGGSDKALAYRLYERSLSVAQQRGDLANASQAALRVAGFIGDEESEGYGAPYDPFRALELYQLAERGLRLDIANGLTYYRKRLAEVLEGQENMRGKLTFFLR